MARSLFGTRRDRYCPVVDCKLINERGVQFDGCTAEAKATEGYTDHVLLLQGIERPIPKRLRRPSMTTMCRIRHCLQRNRQIPRSQCRKTYRTYGGKATLSIEQSLTDGVTTLTPLLDLRGG